MENTQTSCGSETVQVALSFPNPYCLPPRISWHFLCGLPVLFRFSVDSCLSISVGGFVVGRGCSETFWGVRHCTHSHDCWHGHPPPFLVVGSTLVDGNRQPATVDCTAHIAYYTTPGGLCVFQVKRCKKVPERPQKKW